MLVNVECPCGQPYEFEVEPVNGKMPVEVRCPSCGADGTELANAFIARNLSSQPVAPGAPAVRAETPLKVSSASVAPPASPAGLVRSQVLSTPKSAGTASAQSNLMPGVLGAVGGGLVGMIGWYLLIKWTGYEIGYAAWGVGVLTGLGARMLSREGNKVLAVVAAVCAFAAVVGGQYLAVKSQFNEAMTGHISDAYDKRMTYAQAAIKAQTDDELKAALASYTAENGQTPNPAAISSEQIEAFKQQELPALQAFVKGKPSKSEFEAIVRQRLNSMEIQGRILKDSLSPFTLLWLFLGVGSAYKIAGRND